MDQITIKGGVSMTEKIKSALKLRHSSYRQWIYFDECPVGTGYKCSNWIDGYAIAAWPSDGNKRISYEIKISRQDFLNEIKKPWKRRPAMFFSNEFYFVAPKGLLKKDEIPIECGLIEYEEKEENKKDRLTTVLKAPNRESIRPNWNFVAALLRRLYERNEILEREINKLKPQPESR